MDPLTVTRRTALPADRREVWRHLTDTALLGAWLGADVDVEVSPGSMGTVTFGDGRRRQIVVTHVEDERRVGFVWWDGADADEVSAVELHLDDDTDAADRAVLTVTETLDPSPSPVGALGGRACLTAEAGAAMADEWGLRLDRLGMLADRTAPVLV